MRNNPPGPILLVESGPALLRSVLERSGETPVLCAGSSAALSELRQATGPAPSVVFFAGGLRAVLREFPLFWGEIHVAEEAGIAAAAESLAAGGQLHWHAAEPARAVAVAAGLVERGRYARFTAWAAGVTLIAAPATPARGGVMPGPEWSSLRTLLDALDEAGAPSAAAIGEAIRPFRQAWLQPLDHALRAGWPYRQEPGAGDSVLSLPPTLPDGRPWPRISIVTPCLNQGRYIEETLLSVRQQRYPDLEHIVVDGGSTDETMAIVDRYADGLAHIVSEPDRGQSHAINKGMALASGEILGWLNSDDMLAPGALAAAALGLATSGADLVAGICRLYRDGVLVGEHLTACADGPLPRDDLLDLDGGWNAGQFFYQPEVFFTRDLWRRAGARVEESLHYSMDYELWLRFAEQGGRLHVLGRPLAWFRLHDEQKTRAEAAFKAELAAFRAGYLKRTRYRPKSKRPAPDHNRTLRVAIVNDIGWQFGAGIAQRRLAQAIERGGHTAVSIALAAAALPPDQPGAVTIAELEERIAESQPDLVLFGNVHGARLEPAALAPILARWPSLVAMHDLWWLTGRCVYNGACRKYLAGCDAECPTPGEYPALAPDRIARAWRDKRLLYAGSDAPVILANSDWAAGIAATALAATGAPPIERFRLGFPLDVFRPRDRRHCRDRLGLPPDRFIVLVSAATLLEPRKGADQLRDLIAGIELTGILFVTVGHGEIGGLDIPGDRLRSLGHVGDPERLAELYAAADVLVSPSTEETFGQVFVEASACGTPVIGHDVSGVSEALSDGVTGLLTRSTTAAGLEAALLELYRRPMLRRDLGSWGRLHCENEWSLDACYRSLFVALRRSGLADRLGLAHKITFPAADCAPAPPDFFGADSRKWRRGAGMGPREGPHPDHGMLFAFHWCCGPESRFDLICRRDGRHLLVIEYQNLHFERLAVELLIDGRAAGREVLCYTSTARTALAYFPVDLTAGEHLAALHFGQWREPDSTETRRLAMMLLSVDLIAL